MKAVRAGKTVPGVAPLHMLQRVRHLLAPAPLLVVLVLLSAAPAAASPNAVVRDCAQDGFVEVDRYSREDLRRGRDRIPADLAEYSDCTSQINAALDRPRARSANNRGGFLPGGDGGATGAGPGGSSGNSGGSQSPPTGSGQRDAATSESKRRLARGDADSLLDGRDVAPGSAAAGAFDQTDAGGGISLPLLLAIIAVALALAAGVALALLRRDPELPGDTAGRAPRPRGLGSLPSLRRRR